MGAVGMGGDVVKTVMPGLILAPKCYCLLANSVACCCKNQIKERQHRNTSAITNCTLIIP